MNDTMQKIINDAHNLAKAAIAPDLVQPCVETIARRLERLVKNGFYVTPEAARKIVEKNLSFEDAPDLNKILATPPFGKGGAEEEARERFGKYLSVPALGMQFRRYRSANTTILVATWRDQKECNSHVYVVRVERDGDSPNCGWRATAKNDGHVVFQLRTKNRSNCEHFAFSAMKRYLKRGHRRTYRTIAKANKEEK